MSPEKVKELMLYGFTETAVRQALTLAHGSMNEAAAALFAQSLEETDSASDTEAHAEPNHASGVRLPAPDSALPAQTANPPAIELGTAGESVVDTEGDSAPLPEGQETTLPQSQFLSYQAPAGFHVRVSASCGIMSQGRNQ